MKYSMKYEIFRDRIYRQNHERKSVKKNTLHICQCRPPIVQTEANRVTCTVEITRILGNSFGCAQANVEETRKRGNSFRSAQDHLGSDIDMETLVGNFGSAEVDNLEKDFSAVGSTASAH